MAQSFFNTTATGFRDVDVNKGRLWKVNHKKEGGQCVGIYQDTVDEGLLLSQRSWSPSTIHQRTDSLERNKLLED
jgi:hypothetical protein